jgi:SAM-dependent methyltransferase
VFTLQHYWKPTTNCAYVLLGEKLEPTGRTNMDDYYSSNYGDRVADVYDRWYPASPAHDLSCIKTLAGLVGDGSALELGPGTGRFALPLAQQGCHVSVMDNSEKLLEKLRAKPGADKLSLVLGDMADLPIEGRFDLIYSLQSFYYLFTQPDQIRCFCNVRRKLTERGVFVIETWLPPRTLSQEWSNVSPFSAPGSIGMFFSRADVAKQMIELQIARTDNKGTTIIQERVRYVWPTELDLLAHIAGLIPCERWGDWDKGQFTSQSSIHIGVYKPLT